MCGLLNSHYAGDSLGDYSVIIERIPGMETMRSRTILKLFFPSFLDVSSAANVSFMDYDETI